MVIRVNLDYLRMKKHLSKRSLDSLRFGLAYEVFKKARRKIKGGVPDKKLIVQLGSKKYYHKITNLQCNVITEITSTYCHSSTINTYSRICEEYKIPLLTYFNLGECIDLKIHSLENKDGDSNIQRSSIDPRVTSFNNSSWSKRSAYIVYNRKR